MFDQAKLLQFQADTPEMAELLAKIKQMMLDGATTEQLLEAINAVLDSQAAASTISEIELKKIVAWLEEKREADELFEIATEEEVNRWDLSGESASSVVASQAVTATDAAPAAEAGGTSASTVAAAGVSYGSFALGLGVLALAGGGGSSSGSTQTSGLTVTQSVDDSGSDKVITLTFAFDEDVTGFEADDVSVTGGTKGTLTTVSPSVYTLDVTSSTADTAVSYSVAQGAATTAADSTANAAASGSFDLTAPALSNIQTSAADQTVTLTFNEDMGSAAVSAFTFTFDGTVVAASSATVDGSSIVFSFPASSFAAGDSIEIDFDGSAGALEDAVGNDAEAFDVSSGLTADGYIKGATIFLELEDGSRVDTGIITDANGNFFLTPEAQDVIAAFTGSFSIVAVGGFNVDTGLPNTQEMRAPQGSTVVNPLTTLIEQVVRGSGGDLSDATTIQAAQTSVKTALGITSTQDLTSFDPISAAVDGDADALAVQQVAAKVATVIAFAEETSGQDAKSEEVVNSLVEKIAAAETIDLESTTVLEELTGAEAAEVADLSAATVAIAAASDIDAISNQQAALLDNVAPSAPTLALTAGSDTGSDNTDGLVNTATVDLRVSFDTSASDGTAVSLGNVIKLYSESDLETVLATHTVTDGDLNRGSFIFEDVALDSAETGWVTTITDKAGNASELSDVLTVTLDTDAPTAGIEAPISDGYINAAEDDVALTVAGTAVGSEAGQKVTLTLSDGSETRTKTGMVSNEAFSIRVSAYDLQQLAEGEITVTATVVDVAGNSDSTSVTYVYDATAPAAPGNLALVTDSGSGASDGLTNSLAITAISGIEAGAAAEYSINGGAWASEYTAPTTDGDYTIQARQTDVAGNVSEVATIEVVLDATAPSVSTVSFAIDEDTTAVASLTASEQVVWSLGEGADNALFTLSESGALAFASAPDFETDETTYTVNVIATDEAGNLTAQAIQVSVNDVNELPTVTADIPSQTAVTDQLYSLDLSQYFADEDAADATLTYQLSGDLPAGLSFANGVISGTATATAASSEFTVTATDSAGNEIEQTFALQSVEAPAIVSFALTDATGAPDAGDEGSALTVVATVSEAFTLTLNDASPTITLNFGETSATATYVSHDGSAGTITFSATAPAGDASSTSISAIDLGAATLIGDLSGQPLITDAYGSANTSYTLDNTAPIVSPVSFTVDENTTAVTTLTANEPTTWSLSEGGDNASFTLSESGALALASAPDFESDATSYTVNVVATDAVGNQRTQAIQVQVNDVNEAPTVASAIPQQTAVTDQAYSLDLSQYFADVDAADDTLTYQLTGELPAGLSLANGVISGTATATAASAEFTVTATDSAGNDVAQTFSLQSVEAPAIVSFALTDSTGSESAGNQGSSLTVVATVSEAFTLTLNDATPTITLNFGETTAIATYVSHDGSTLTFSATAPAGDAASTSISAIDLGAATLVGSFSGQPLITEAFGSPNTTYRLDNTVAQPEADFAADTGTSDQDNITNDATILVQLADDVASWEYTTDGGSTYTVGTGTSFEMADDTVYAPEQLGVRQTDLAGNLSETNFDPDGTTTDMTAPVFSSNANFSLQENTIAAGDVTADSDDVSYSLSGTDADAFSISDTGALVLNNAADFETQGSYAITVTATDLAGNSITQAVTVNVTDQNEAPVAEGSIATQTAVVDGDAFELDLSTRFSDVDAGDSLTYSVTSGALPNGLTLNTNTGVISGTATASTSSAASESVTITATDSGGLSVTQTFDLQARTAGELDTADPIFISGDTGASLFDAFAPDTVLYSATAVDQTDLTYSISGDDAQFFSIDELSGDITLNTSAFSNPAGASDDEDYDFDDDGYTLIVTATDQAGNTATKEVSVNVTPVIEFSGNRVVEESVFTATSNYSDNQLTITVGLDDEMVTEAIGAYDFELVYNAADVASISFSGATSPLAGAVTDNGDGTSTRTVSWFDTTLSGFDASSTPAFDLTLTLTEGVTSTVVLFEAPVVTIFSDDSQVGSLSDYTDVYFNTSTAVTGTAASEAIAVSGEAVVTGGAGADLFYVEDVDSLQLTLNDFTSGEDVLDISSILYEDIGWDSSEPEWVQGDLSDYIGQVNNNDIEDGDARLAREVTASNFQSDFGFFFDNGEWTSASASLDQAVGAFVLNTGNLLVFADVNPNVGSDDVVVGSFEVVMGSNSTFHVSDLALSTPYFVTGTAGDDRIDLMGYQDTDSTNGFDADIGGFVVTGGGGADTFLIDLGGAATNSIVDFEAGVDTIDITAALADLGYQGFDEDASTAANDVGRLIGSNVDLGALVADIQDADDAAYDVDTLIASVADQPALASADNAAGVYYSADARGAFFIGDADSDAGSVALFALYVRMDEVSTSDLVVDQSFIV